MDLKIARQIAKLTQVELAERSGVAQSTISQLENDRRNYETVGYADVVNLARALGVEPGDLFPVPAPEARP